MEAPEENLTSLQQSISFDFPIMGQNITYGQEVFRKSVVIVGVFLNCLVFFVVMFSRQMRYPRHTFWAVIAFFECVFLVKCVLELAVIVHHDHLACQILVLLAPVDYSILLLCLSLAALDRYLAIVRYEWYKSSVSNRGVIALISLLSTLTFVVITTPFWTGYFSIYTCTNNLTHMHWILVWDLFLGTAGVILHLMIFVESKALIQQYVPNRHQKPITVRFVHSSARQHNSLSGRGVEQPPSNDRIFFSFPKHSTLVENERNSHQHLPAHQPSSIENFDNECFPWIKVKNQGGSKFNRLEIRAALNMSVNILPFWLCTFPVSCSIVVLYWCIRLEGECGSILLPWPYLWNLFLLHSVYNPVMYMATSSEFWRALVHITNKVAATFHIKLASGI
ncbi:uncharacterized protein LOC130703691 [Daphnia carinata]|uniref:uncharacterized protein LOC130703691 n=1 Tax=Daphnia carinata TaxID=120202 RepID=UPI00257A5D05|nr:uncharacterized protein LOC130703691 [Daphnia carinata]